MTPHGLTRHIANSLSSKPPTATCPRCQKELPEYRIHQFVDGGVVIWHGCSDCLASAHAQHVPPAISPALVATLWHLVTQPHSAADVDAVAGDVQRALGQRP